MRPEPDPRVIASLCREYPHVSRNDIVACWHNATVCWWQVPAQVMADEPRELTAARALFVHGTLCDDHEERAEHFHGMWSLVSMYIPPKQ